MIDHFKRRRFEHGVLQRVEQDLLEIHGRELGGDCIGFFVTGIQKAQELDGFPKDYVDQLRKRGVAEPDAALAFLDASVTALKRLLDGKDGTEDVERIIAAMENAIDNIFLRNQGMIVPRNGTAGPMMDGFATDMV